MYRQYCLLLAPGGFGVSAVLPTTGTSYIEQVLPTTGTLTINLSSTSISRVLRGSIAIYLYRANYSHKDH